MSGNHAVRPRTSRRVRIAVTLLGLVLVGLVPMAPAQAAAATITVSRGSVIGGESVAVTGKTGVKKARKVVLQRQVSKKKWVTVTRSRSTAAGAYRFSYKPPTKVGTKTVVRVLAPKVKIRGKSYKQVVTGGRSITTVRQTATMTNPSVVAQGAAFTIAGKFAPARSGREVVLQKPVDGRWVKVGTSKVQSSKGEVSFPMTLKAQGTFEFRVTALARSGAPAVASAPATVSVTMPVPTGLSATAKDASVQLSWNAVSANGLLGYNVFRRIDDNNDPVGWGSKVNANLVTGTSFQVSGLENGKTYYFSVTSVSSGDQSVHAPRVSAKPVDGTAPDAPTGVAALAGKASAKISWTKVSSPDLAGYNVYQRINSGDPWIKRTSTLLGEDVVSHTVDGLNNDITYTFAVTSVDGVGNESPKTSQATATPTEEADKTPPPAPATVQAVPGDTTVEVSWSAVTTGDPANYKVYRSDTGEPGSWGSALTTVTVASGNLSYTATGLTNGKTYFFGVEALDASGNRSPTTASLGVKPTPPPAGWASVSTGAQHTCAIGTDDSLWCWGRNVDGQLGSDQPDVQFRSAAPVKVGASSDWTSVSAGHDSTCGVRSNDTLWCWGSNKFGQLGNEAASGTITETKVPVQVPGTTWASVSVGHRFACATTTDAKLFCWGYSADGAVGRLLGQGEDPLGDYPNPSPVSGTSWSTVSAGADHACGTTTTGQLSCWGGNVSGQLGRTANGNANLPAALTGTTWTAVSAGEYHTCAIRGGNDEAVCWGQNTKGELGKAASTEPDSTLSSIGTGWTSISAGGDHTCGTKADGVYCFGANAAGQLGKDANTAANPTPTKVAGTTGAWTSADSGTSTSCARTTANKVFCWGSNDEAQVGDPATINANPHPARYEVAVP